MYINVHLDKQEISKALKKYIEEKGFVVKSSQPQIRIEINKGDAKEPETWDAVVCGCEQALKESEAEDG